MLRYSGGHTVNFIEVEGKAPFSASVPCAFSQRFYAMGHLWYLKYARHGKMKGLIMLNGSSQKNKLK